MNRALVRDFDEFGALFIAQRSGQMDVALDPIDFPFLGFALLAIDRVDL